MWDYTRPSSTTQYNYGISTTQLPAQTYKTPSYIAPIKVNDDAYRMDVMCMNCQNMISVEEIGEISCVKDIKSNK